LKRVIGGKFMMVNAGDDQVGACHDRLFVAGGAGLTALVEHVIIGALFGRPKQVDGLFGAIGNALIQAGLIVGAIAKALPDRSAGAVYGVGIGAVF
jgi:hypothetical protein